MDSSSFSLHDDPILNEDRAEEDLLLRRRGYDPGELSEEERSDLVDDIRGDAVSGDDDDDQLSDVLPPEEADGND